MTALATPPAPAVADRLLHGSADPGYRAHVARYGPLPSIRRRDPAILAEVAASGLAGRGGGGFPTGAKLDAVARGWRTAVIANGIEGEPASAKDAVLLAHNPHLVLDGLAVAARLVGARTATIAVAEGGAAADALSRAIAERAERGRPQLALMPDRFVAGEESAVVSALKGGAGLPTGRRPFADGVLVQNVETLAHLALVVRHGASWFRTAGTHSEPGTALATVSGAVSAPGVVEFELGATLGELFEKCGGVLERVDAVLIGGYFGRWLPADAALELSSEALGARGGSLGARVIVALPSSACGLTEVARVVRYMAGESAGQCGPCVFGLPALAEALDVLVAGHHTEQARQRLTRLRAQITRRGACQHPDGTLGFLTSALEVFAEEVENHHRGFCTATSDTPILPTPTLKETTRR
jgi:NADH:ubiquinone oxidoreductase subunit F (NADH-binding)